MPGQIEPIERMVSELSRLPGIGHKTAARLAYHIVGMPLEDVHALAAALWQGRKAIRYCDVCGNFSSAEKCAVCADESRHNGQICVVRDPRDVAAMEPNARLPRAVPRPARHAVADGRHRAG